METSLFKKEKLIEHYTFSKEKKTLLFLKYNGNMHLFCQMALCTSLIMVTERGFHLNR